MEKTLNPGSVWGQVNIPASKSQTIHTLLIALFARGVSRIHNPLICEDTRACMDFCKALGAQLTYGDNTLWIDSLNLRPTDGRRLDCKSSGTTLYFATALSCALDVKVGFTGDEPLLHRPVRPLLNSLHDLGATVDLEAEHAPYQVQGPLEGGHTSIRCNDSVQHLTALLLAAPLAKGDTTIDVHLLKEKSAVRMTELWLSRQNIEYFRDDDMNHFTIKGGQCYKPFSTEINGDFSLASYLLCAAAITGGTITINGLDANSSQADRKILPILQTMGCSVRCEGHTVTLTGPSRLKAADFDLGDVPDLLPPLAITSCFASGPVKLTNVSMTVVRGSKERTSTIANDINVLGGQAQVTGDTLVVYPASAFSGTSLMHSFGDPRIAMALALASLRCTKGLTIADTECVEEIFPSFFEKFSSVSLSSI